jgi:hypothetical protein
MNADMPVLWVRHSFKSAGQSPLHLRSSAFIRGRNSLLLDHSAAATWNAARARSTLLQQAMLAWSLAVEIDGHYLDKRIKTETTETLDLARFEELVVYENDQT